MNKRREKEILSEVDIGIGLISGALSMIVGMLIFPDAAAILPVPILIYGVFKVGFGFYRLYRERK